MLFLNRPIRAPKALEWGLVNRCVPRDQLDMAVDDLSHELLAKLPETVRATKAQVHFWKDLSWALTIRQAREWLTIHAASAEVRSGLESFRERRLPDYEALRESAASAGSGFCPGCGTAAEPDWHFCPSCGAALVSAGEGGAAG
jgi:1,4-dihydroxy-2-naphthoyl-CoA synthase